MKVLKNKKGAALVAVLIGILFIAILASSLLYMSTMNYQMKSMHQFSTDNFYTAEYAMDDMLAQLKQYCSIQDKPMDSLKTLLKDNDGNGHTIFKESVLQGLIGIDSYVTGLDPNFPTTGAGGVQIGCIYKDNTGAYTRNTYEETDNYIYLRGVQITVKTDEAHGNYKSTITTDLAFGFPAKGGGSAGLNDFSILMDSPIYVRGGSQHFCGAVYCRYNNSNSAKTTIGEGNAFRVGANSIVSLLGGFSFFDGDLVVDSTGSLFVSGNCFVNGKVTVAGTGQLIVGGTMYVKDGVTGPNRTVNGGQVKANDSTVDWAFYDDFDDGLANKLVAEHMHLHLSSAATSMTGYVDGSTTNDMKLTQEMFKTEMNAGTNATGKMNTATVGGRTVNAIYLTNGVTHDFNNTLIISPIGQTSFHGNTYNCTWLCTCTEGAFTIGEGGGVAQYLNIWGHMDDESYDAAKKLFFQAEWPNNYGGKLPKFDGMGYSMDDLVHDETGGSGNDYELNGVTYHWYTNGSTTDQPYYYMGTSADDQLHNLFPFENFFDDEMEQTLFNFMQGTAGGGSDSSQPTIIINNWTKE